MRRLLFGALTLLLLSVAIPRAAQSKATPAELADLLARVGAAVERYFARAQSLICTETVTLMPIGNDLMPDNSPARNLTYELRVAWEPNPDGGLPEATVQRQLLKIGSRAPRPSDKPGCTDPKEMSTEPLAFLLPGKQDESIFTFVRATKVNGRAAIMVDYKAREMGPITSTMSGEDCWSIDLPGRQRGRIWVDAVTNEVLRVDERLTGMFEVTLPRTKNHDRQTMTIERLDSSIIYRPVTFSDPDETVMLPQSIQSVQIVRNSGSPRFRKTQRFTNYRRFMTAGRIVQH